MRRYLVFAGVLIAVAYACWDLGHRGARAYERMLTQRVENGLDVLGFRWAQIRADGLKLELHGHAPDIFAQELALESARATAPIAQVVSFATATLSPPEHRDPVRVELHRDSRGITLIGQSASREMRDRLAQLLGRHGPDLEVQDLTGIQAAEPPRGFGPELDVAALAITSLRNSFVVLEPGQVSVDAHALDEDQRDAVTQRLLDAAREEIAVVLRLTIPSYVVAPFAFSANKDISGGIRLESCAVRTADEQAALLAELRGMVEAEQTSVCPVGLGGPRGDWLGAISAGLTALSELPAGRLEISYRAVRLIGYSPTSPNVFEAVLETFGKALPEGYSGNGELRADDAVTKDGISRGSYWMHLARGPDGLTINGQMPDETGRMAVATYAAALLGSDKVSANIQEMHSPAPAGWQTALLRIIELLARIDGAEVQLAGHRASFDAMLAAPESAKQLHDELLETLPDFEVSTRFEIDLPKAYQRIALPAKRCSHELSQIIRAKPIDFDTGSAVLTKESQAAMDALVALLKRCDGSPIEIGGHTDAQGSEDLNERLSKARAEAVRTALVNRGVSLDRLVARGYGETVPIADNKTDAGRARNRRIEFKPAE